MKGLKNPSFFCYALIFTVVAPRSATAWSSFVVPSSSVVPRQTGARIILPRPTLLTPHFSRTATPRGLDRFPRRAITTTTTQRYVSVKVDGVNLEESSTTALATEVAPTPTTKTNPFLEALVPVASLLNVNLDTVDWTKAIGNGLILLVTLGYAAYTILDVDHGMTRGWTQSEIAMRIPLDNWASYETSLAEKPIYTKTLINVVIYLLGDWLSQTVFQKKNVLDFDPWRTLRNGFIGLCFGPLVHQYYQFSDYILPLETGGLTNRVLKILMDQTIYLTVKCSIYIMAVGLLAGDSFETTQNSVKTRIKGIVFTAWKFWPLVHCITYSVIPARHRILWVNCVDLIWSAILASMSNAAPTPVDADDNEEAESEAIELNSNANPNSIPLAAVSAAKLQAVMEEAQALLDPTVLTETFAAAQAELVEKLEEVVDLSVSVAAASSSPEAAVSVEATTDDGPTLSNTTFALSH